MKVLQFFSKIIEAGTQKMRFAIFGLIWCLKVIDSVIKLLFESAFFNPRATIWFWGGRPPEFLGGFWFDRARLYGLRKLSGSCAQVLVNLKTLRNKHRKLQG